MMDSQSETNRIPALIFSACGAWERATGRKLTEPSAVGDLFRALKTNEQIWQGMLATTWDDAEMREAAKQLRATLAAVEITPDMPLPDILAKLDVSPEIQQLFLNTLNNASRREQMIKTAFAADSPAATAAALTAVADQDNKSSNWQAIAKGTSAKPSIEPTAVAIGVIVISIIAIFIIFGPQIKNMFAMYKGVTPDTMY